MKEQAPCLKCGEYLRPECLEDGDTICVDCVYEIPDYEKQNINLATMKEQIIEDAVKDAMTDYREGEDVEKLVRRACKTVADHLTAEQGKRMTSERIKEIQSETAYILSREESREWGTFKALNRPKTFKNSIFHDTPEGFDSCACFTSLVPHQAIKMPVKCIIIGASSDSDPIIIRVNLNEFDMDKDGPLLINPEDDIVIPQITQLLFAYPKGD